MTSYRTKEGDVLDAVVRQFYGDRPGALEHVLSANHGLASAPAVLPAGVRLNLPPMPADPPAARDQVKLWGF